MYVYRVCEIYIIYCTYIHTYIFGCVTYVYITYVHTYVGVTCTSYTYICTYIECVRYTSYTVRTYVHTVYRMCDIIIHHIYVHTYVGV